MKIPRRIQDSATEGIGVFIHQYQKTVSDYHESPEAAVIVEELTRAIKSAISRHKPTIYCFGNGGSHAISRHLELSLKRAYAGTKFKFRTNHGMDFHQSQAITTKEEYDDVFSHILLSEGADSNDLVILTSGSGDSPNLVKAAKFCKKNEIPSLSIAGFDGGRLTREKCCDSALNVAIHDQQMCEDIIQQCLHMAVKRSYNQLLNKEQSPDHYAAQLKSGLDLVSADHLNRLGRWVSEAYFRGKGVFVLAPEGGSLSLSAEHVAHNLNWDAVFEVTSPPKRYLRSTPTSCDFSGIGNDRFQPGIASCQQLHMAERGHVLLLYGTETENPSVKATLEAARVSQMRVAFTVGKTAIPDNGDPNIVFAMEDEDLLADLAQMTGHMLGRIVRMKIKQHINEPVDKDLGNFLIQGDLAQRRLIHAVSGL